MIIRPLTSLLLIATVVLSSTVPANADDSDKSKPKRRVVAPVKVDDDKDDAADEEDDATVFEVPDGTPKELFAFIDGIKELEPKERDQEAVIAHLTRQIQAVLDAADAILAQDIEDEDAVRAVEEKFQGLSLLTRFDDSGIKQLASVAKKLASDKRPAVAKIAQLQLLQISASEAIQGSKEDQQKMVDDLFAFMGKHGLDIRLAGLIGSVGEVLQSDNPALAASTLMKLGNVMKESDDPRMVSQAESILGTARFLNLPGNFLELSGVDADGEEFDWESYRGKVVLVDFWATWCGPCRAEVPNVVRNLKKFGDKGFSVVGINLDRERSDFDEYMEESELPWANIMPDDDGNSPMAVRYGITGIPTVILVDREGNVVSTKARGRELGRLLTKILGPAEADEVKEEKEEDKNRDRRRDRK